MRNVSVAIRHGQCYSRTTVRRHPPDGRPLAAFRIAGDVEPRPCDQSIERTEKPHGDRRPRPRRPGRSDGRARRADRVIGWRRPATTIDRRRRPSTRCTMTRPPSSHIAQTSPRRGRAAATTLYPGAVGDRPAHRAADRVDPQRPRLGAAAQQACDRGGWCGAIGHVVPLAVWSKPHATSRPSGRSGRRAVGRRRAAMGSDRGAVRRLHRKFDGSPQLRLQFGRRPPELPDRAPDLSYTGIDVWLGGDGAACRSVSGVAARRHGDDIRVGGPGDDPRVAGPRTRPDLRPGVGVPPQRPTRVGRCARRARSAHAARRIDPQRRPGGLAVGGTGAGKSTLAYAASRHADGRCSATTSHSSPSERRQRRSHGGSPRRSTSPAI